jgi:hypothetical protein
VFQDLKTYGTLDLQYDVPDREIGVRFYGPRPNGPGNAWTTYSLTCP